MMSYNLKWEQHSAENLVHSSSAAPYIFRRILYTHTDTHTYGEGVRQRLRTNRIARVQRRAHICTFWAPSCDSEIVLQKKVFCRAPASELSFRSVGKGEKFAAQVRRFQHDVHACIWCCAHLRRAASSLASKVDRNSSLSAALMMLPTHEPIYVHYWYTCN
jgi:hypothetical protein